MGQETKKANFAFEWKQKIADKMEDNKDLLDKTDGAMLDPFILAAKKLIGKYEMETHIQF